MGSDINRRSFLGATAAAAFSVVDARLVRGSQANSRIELGLIGCGGRGVWIAELFKQHGGYQWVAGADYFEDRVGNFGQKFSIDASRRYTGLAGHKRMLEGRLDAVVIESPPYFHPQQAADAVAAGRHVFVAKPIAVDVMGCLTIAQAAKDATARKLVFLVDFQTRADAIYREAVKRVHNGDIGRLVSGEAVYYTGGTWADPTFDPNNAEQRLRFWGVDRLLSGDIITEQNIHALDVATWIIDEDPLAAVGFCGRKARGGSGNCNDHFTVIYRFPGELLLSFASKQYGEGMEDIGVRVFGTRGTVDTHYFGSVSIRGQIPYAGGTMKNLYTDGAVANIAEFHRSITAGQFDNPTAAPSVRSNLTTILGRMAAYRRQPVTWEEMLKSNEKIEVDLRGLKV